MQEPLKNLYNQKFIDRVFDSLKSIKLTRDKKEFYRVVFDKGWDELELKQRMRHLSMVVNSCLASDFNQKCLQIIVLKDQLEKSKANGDGFLCIFLPQIIEDYGLNNLEESVNVFEKITSFTTCEFAIRPFIEKYETQMFKVLNKWAKHKNEHVRRLASEGCRPLLPWGGVLQNLKINPSPILEVLEKLKNDPSEYVRRSVANNLNDISKNNPEILLSFLKKWQNEPDQTQAILKHACRTLLKVGNEEALNYFGWVFDKNLEIKLDSYTNNVDAATPLNFQFTLTNNDKNSRKIRLEFAIYFLKQNGTHNKKVFQITNSLFKPKENKKFTKQFSFKPISTRVYHKGIHHISLIVNGNEFERNNFKLH